MAKIPEHILNEIQDRCDIVEVISNYIPLKPAGRNFKMLCPFHHEKTPSFVVSPDKQIYHCFGCHSGGNVFNFVKEYEKIDFIDAVKLLAQKTGVKLPEYKKEKSEEESFVSTIYSINDIAATFYSDSLVKAASSSVVRRYLDKRGLEEETIKKFKLGYADSSWRSFSGYLSKRGISGDLALKAGIVSRGKDGSFYDLFRDRLVFPIWNVRGKIIGFGARVLDDSLPKYLNSPETHVYKKGQNLFGLNFAKAHIREKNFAVISEGYLDVITSHQYGISNVISSSGTALTSEQIRVLRRYTHNVVMVYDQDQAGEMATLRGLDLFLEEGMNVKVASLDKGHDPDSFIRKFGPRGFNAAIKKAKSLFYYKLHTLMEKFDVNEPESKGDLVKEMLLTIRRVRNSVIKAEYIKKLSGELSIKEEAIWDELKSMKKPPAKRDTFSRRTLGGSATKGRAKISIHPAEKILARLMLEDVNVIDVVRNNLKPFDFTNPDIRCLMEELFSLDGENTFIDARKLINYLEDKVAPNVISYIVNEDVELGDKERNITDCIKVIKKERRSERLKEIQDRLSLAQQKGYGDEAKRLLEEFNKILQENLSVG